MMEVDQASEALSLVEQGMSNLHQMEQSLGHTPGRSHTLFSLHAEDHAFNFVLLAGSERINIDRNDPSFSIIQTESVSIAKSLSTLRTCLLSTETHVPYRDSRLTSVLKQALQSPCILLACVLPSDLSESISTLNYAQNPNLKN
jgi:hypothetical protein